MEILKLVSTCATSCIYVPNQSKLRFLRDKFRLIDMNQQKHNLINLEIDKPP